MTCIASKLKVLPVCNAQTDISRTSAEFVSKLILYAELLTIQLDFVHLATQDIQSKVQHAP
jgi:hypothetical protein